NDLDSLERIVQETGILLLSDEVYEHLVFDGQLHQSVARRPLLVNHSIVVSSFGKTYSATGWKIGYFYSLAPISAEIRKLHQFNVSTVTSPMQFALADYMKSQDAYLRLPAFYQEKRDRLLNGLVNTKFAPMH